jgi:hypothetical protein
MCAGLCLSLTPAETDAEVSWGIKTAGFCIWSFLCSVVDGSFYASNALVTIGHNGYLAIYEGNANTARLVVSQICHSRRAFTQTYNDLITAFVLHQTMLSNLAILFQNMTTIVLVYACIQDSAG